MNVHFRQILLFLLQFFSFSTFSQKQVLGDSLVPAGSIKPYTVNASLANLEWKIIPETAGIILSQNQNSVSISWSYHSSAAPMLCSLAVFITYPNADNSYNYFLPIKVQPFIPDTNFNSRRSKFSRTSKDSLRFWYRHLCDTARFASMIQLKDSSLAKTQNYTWHWHFRDMENKKEITAQGQTINIRLKPGKYLLTLSNDKNQRVSDTLTILAPPIPELNVSTQTPCSGTGFYFKTSISNTMNCSYLQLDCGDGRYSMVPATTEKLYQTYAPSQDIMNIFIANLSAIDRYGCAYSSNTLAIAPQRNQFTVFNTLIEPMNPMLNKPGDKIELKCKTGNGFQIGNPNTPFTYLWNTGQTSPAINVSNPGSYSLLVWDKLGCKSQEIGPVYVKQNFKTPGAPIVSGPKEIKAREKAEFKITPLKSGFYQFKFIFNDNQSFVTEPSTSPSTSLPDWEKSQAGNLKVIGIHLKAVNGYHSSFFSDTLSVQITE
ncbi:MAG: hypothetical protein MUF75_02695 [Bacteroidia bacterium]|jgi:hypothetical protein|nr:hypothetical protein [Bacteroidia bacterium]